MSDEKKPDKELSLFGSRILEPEEKPSKDARFEELRTRVEEPSVIKGINAGVSYPGPRTLFDVDPTALAFFRRLYDPASYATAFCPKEALESRGFVPQVFYDTITFSETTYEERLFMIPRGQLGKTELETNLNVGGQLTFGNQVFVFSTMVLRFLSMTGFSRLWEKGLLSCEGFNEVLMRFPISSMAPLYPSAGKKIFFWTGRTIWSLPNESFGAAIRVSTPAYWPTPVKVRVELHGLLAQNAATYFARYPDDGSVYKSLSSTFRENR